jgi:hypothetical protein
MNFFTFRRQSGYRSPEGCAWLFSFFSRMTQVFFQDGDDEHSAWMPAQDTSTPGPLRGP